MELFGLIKDDWQKIPQNVRFFVLSGSLLLLITWVSDHWGTISYNLFGWNFRTFFFSAGISLILIGLMLILSKQVYIYGNLLRLRLKYPVKDHPKKFALIWFRPGRLYLFDKKNKTTYHVQPWETAEDLRFIGLGYSLDDDYETALRTDVKIPSPYAVKVKNYRNVGQLNTRK